MLQLFFILVYLLFAPKNIKMKPENIILYILLWVHLHALVSAFVLLVVQFVSQSLGQEQRLEVVLN